MTTRHAPPLSLVVFGASGDLTARKLIPALCELADQGSLDQHSAVVGVSRSELTEEQWARKLGPEIPIARQICGDYADGATYERLREVLDELDRTAGTAGNRLYYLATPPHVFPVVVAGLARHGLNRPGEGGAFARIVIEKPYGHDRASAIALDECVHAAFPEDDVYRIDHYLGKETVQNVLALRFANAIYEPIWNRRYVDHVQITVAETLGVEGRGSFYEHAGALRDIVQNHVMQVLALTCMEPPAVIDAQGIRDEKVKALRAVDVFTPAEAGLNTVRGQYAAGLVEGRGVPGYRDESNVAPASQTETYVAMKLMVDNWRWAGVPFYVRAGKRLAKRVTEVDMVFKGVPHLPFKATEARGLRTNALILRIQPDEGITLKFGAKVPGSGFDVRTAEMDFTYSEAFAEEAPDAYERLLLDAMVGDPTLFIRSDEVLQAWAIVEPVLDAWNDPEMPLHRYHAGSWGPVEADLLLAREGRRWREI